MASDVEQLSTIYANLPSIFEMSSTDLTESSSTEKTYQPMFGSFLFAESEPFTHAAFVPSTFSSINREPTDEKEIDEASTKDSTPLALIDMAADDEDDFDGIPIRHASTMSKDMLNNPMENDQHDEDDDEEELFLNDFIDGQQQQQQQADDITRIPSLFNNIPDIDDLNEHLDDDEIADRIPFDPLDMLDQSDSIRSSSPDSVLSSSHLRDDDDDDDDDDYDNDNAEDIDDEMNQIDDVTQWNDEDLLRRTTFRTDRPNAPLPPSQLNTNLQSDQQVNFIDSSRSGSRCSNASSHLSFGYADQARVFLNDDDGLVSSSSDSENDYEQENVNIWENVRFSRENSDEDISLQVNLDYHPSRLISPASSPRSASSIPIRSPIVAIDEEIHVSNTNIPSAPMANVDDEDDVDEDLPILPSDQPILSPVPLKNLFQLKTENRQMEIVHEVINMRHIFDEHENDDEFLAIMHNPTVFEDVLYVDDDQQVNFLLNYLSELVLQ